MIAIALSALAIILTILCIRKTMALGRSSRQRGFAYYFYACSLEFLIPLSIAAILYLGLWAVVSWCGVRSSLGFLIALEDVLTNVKEWLSIFRLTPFQVLLLLVALYLVALIQLRRGMASAIRDRVHTGLSAYTRWTRRVCTLLAILCSFTLLGSQVGPPTDQVRIRIKTIRQGYADVAQQMNTLISDEVATRLADKVNQALPEDYRKAVADNPQIGPRVVALQARYVSARSSWGVRVPAADKVTSEYARARDAAAQLPRVVVLEGPSARTGTLAGARASESAATGGSQARATRAARSASTGEAGSASVNAAKTESVRASETTSLRGARNVSLRQVRQAQARLREVAAARKPRVIEFLAMPEGRRLACQMPKVLTSKVASTLLEPIYEHVPLAKPAIDSFLQSINNTTEAKINRAAEKATAEICHEPARLGDSVNSGAKAVVAQTPANITPEIATQASQQAARYQATVAEIGQADAAVTQQVQVAKDRTASRLISQLSSSNWKAAEQASARLSQMEGLSKASVDRIASVMRGSRGRWTTTHYRSWEGAHCETYEYRSRGYYAARTLANMKSPHVTSRMTQEAQNAMSNSDTTERVNDPGWI